MALAPVVVEGIGKNGVSGKIGWRWLRSVALKMYI
jgi:hypothetical protein